MSKHSLVVTYAARLCRREWRRFVLPFLSLSITAVVLSLTLLLTNSSSLLLSDQAREFQGGDVVVESTVPIDTVGITNLIGESPYRQSEQLSFTATIESAAAAIAVSVRTVDEAFPLYGVVGLREGTYQHPDSNEIFLDEASAEALEVSVGGKVNFAEASYTVVGIVIAEPTSLLTGFRFLPRVIIGYEGFASAKIDPALLRPEYTYAIALETLKQETAEALRTFESNSNGLYQVRLASEERGGLQGGLGVVREFLIIAVLITAILATANVYASTVYFVHVEQQSFAVMLSLGLTSRRLAGVLGLALLFIVLLGNTIGVLFAKGVFFAIRTLVEDRYMVLLPHPVYGLILGFTTIFLIGIAIAAFVPTLDQLQRLRPKQLLAGDTDTRMGARPLMLLFITAVTLLPLLIASSWLLGSVLRGAGIVLAVIVIYGLIASLFVLLLVALYRVRGKFPFLIRSVIAHKRADGLFGIISFTSLFVALTAFTALVLIQTSIREYLATDLSRTVPSTYILDVQPSQKDMLLSAYPDITLFSNTPARIVAIDAERIQEELAAGNDTVDRELGREFNVTARSELFENDQLTAGTPWTGTPGELSVDVDFAERAGITLGSKVEFSVQGFPLEGVVTSLRQTDSRSGMPFFYFVLSPADLEPFPVVYFGYAYQSEDEQAEISRFVAETMPNVTIIKTQALTPILLKITNLLFVVILVVAIPPLLIAGLLIVTLIISSYSIRRLESARLRALGATIDEMLIQYLAETSALTVSAALLAYGVGVVVTSGVVLYIFEFKSVVLYSPVLAVALCVIISVVLMLGTYLYKTDTMKLRELLSYDSH